MSDIDYLGLDGRSLRLFLAVLESGSVSRAAERLGVSQSAVSHSLEKLRQILGDPLFVRTGRGITPTRRAEALGERAREILERMRELTADAPFEPLRARFTLTIAANDYQRDLLLPALYHRLSAAAPGVTLRIVPSGLPATELLRSEKCDLVVTPFPPDGPDILQKRLFDDELVCFYDARRRPPPASREEYLAARHINLALGEEEHQTAAHERRLLGIDREVVVTVPNFAGIPPFLAGSELLTTLPGLLRFGIMAPFAWAPLPFASAPLTLFMAWHRRNHLDPAQRWVREELEQVVKRVVA